jgi:MYXO-CTERM domain-containing protein
MHRTRNRTLGASLLVILLAAPVPADAYELKCWDWNGNQAYDTNMGGPQTWIQAFTNSMARWNTLLGSPGFAVQTQQDSSYGWGNGQDEIRWSTHATASSFYGPTSSSVLASTWTTTSSTCGGVQEQDILFFVDWNWTLDRQVAATSSAIYFSEVSAHELGHAALLNHESDYMTLMNPSVHAEPLYGYPHWDERQAIDASSEFNEPNLVDHALLPYGTSTTSSLGTSPVSLSGPSVVEPGDTLSVDDLRVENWGTTGSTAIDLDVVLSTNTIASNQDTWVGGAAWSSVGSWGYLGSPVTLWIPSMASGTYYVVAAVDMSDAVNETYTWNNQLVLGQVVVDADGDNDGYDANEDCDDNDPNQHPGAYELCNGLDDNCNGIVSADEQDGDGDGWMVCEGDCDDGNSSIRPGAYESCNGIDDDCSGGIPSSEQDADGDGWMVCEDDCNDGNSSMHPGAGEVCNGADDDCSGSIPSDERDDDNDGWMTCAGDCDDGDSGARPGLDEVCDGADNDCDGDVPSNEQDGDGDGSRRCEDCDDGDDSAFPGGTEVCGNSVDEDCSGGDLPCDEPGDPASPLVPEDEPTDTPQGEQGGGGSYRSSRMGCSAASGRSNPAMLLLLGLAGLLRRRRRGMQALAACAVAVVLATPALATTTIPMVERDLIGLSQTVAVGTVAGLRTEAWGPAEVPVTVITLDVDEVWKGEWRDRLEFYQPGGTHADGRVSHLSGTPTWAPGQEVLVFLERSAAGVPVIAGVSTGALTMEGGRLLPLDGSVDGQPAHAEADGQAEDHTPAPDLPFVGLDLHDARAWVLAEHAAPRPSFVPETTQQEFEAAQAATAGGLAPTMPSP